MAIVSIKWAGLNDPNKQPSFQDATGAAPVVPVPTFTSATTSSYTIAITGYDAQFTYTVSASAGTAVRTGGNVTVSGLTGNQSSTLTVTAANTPRDLSFSSAVAFVSLPDTPTLSRSGGTTTTVTVAIGNYDAGLTYTIGSTVGSATRSGNTITVTGLTQGQAVTVTATASNASGNSAQGSLATGAVPATPTLSVASTTTTSATISITNYDSGATYSVSSTVGSASHSAGTITVTGLSEGQSGTVSATATKNSIASAQGSVGFTIPASYWLSSYANSLFGVASGIVIDNNNRVVTSGNYGNTPIMTRQNLDGSAISQTEFGPIPGQGGDERLDSDSSSYYLCHNGTSGTYSSLVTKISQSMSITWSRKLSGFNNVLQRSVSAVSGDVYATTASYDGSFNQRGHILKYNSSGTLQWQKSFGTPNAAQTFYGIDNDPSGNAYVCGYYNNGSADVGFLLKYNSSGTLQWQRTMKPTSATTFYVFSVSVDASGNAYIVGNNGSFLTYLVKYNSSGVFQWSYEMNVGSYSDGLSVHCNSNDEIFVCCTPASNSASSRPRMFKFNSSGSLLFARTFSSPTYGQVGAIFSNSSAYVVAGNRTTSNVRTVHKLPSNGSKTASYILNGISYVYADYSFTGTANPSFSDSAAPFVESGGRTLTDAAGNASILSNPTNTLTTLSI